MLKRVLCAMLLVGCAEQDPTVGDAIDLIAEGTCERFIRCGWTDLSMERCEFAVRNHYCEKLDCFAPYDVAPVEECFEDYVVAHCNDPLPVCTL